MKVLHYMQIACRTKLSTRNVRELPCIDKYLLYIAQMKPGSYARNGDIETTMGTRNGGIETTMGTRHGGVETTMGTRNGGVETTMSCCAQSQHP